MTPSVGGSNDLQMTQKIFLLTFYDICTQNKKEELQNLQKSTFLVHPNVQHSVFAKGCMKIEINFIHFR